VPDEFEARVLEQVFDVALVAGKEVVQAEDFLAPREQPVAQVRADEPRAAGDEIYVANSQTLLSIKQKPATCRVAGKSGPNDYGCGETVPSRRRTQYPPGLRRIATPVDRRDSIPYHYAAMGTARRFARRERRKDERPFFFTTSEMSHM